MKFCAFFQWNSKISQFTTKLIQNNANKQMNREIGERKKKGRKYFQSYRGWFLVLSMNECHISYEGHTVMGWHFLRDYLHFNMKGVKLCWSGVNYKVTKVGLLSFSEREFYASTSKNLNDMDGQLVSLEWKLVINGKKQWIRETWEQYSHRLVTKLASVTGDSEEILHLISDKLLECTLGVDCNDIS